MTLVHPLIASLSRRDPIFALWFYTTAFTSRQYKTYEKNLLSLMLILKAIHSRRKFLNKSEEFSFKLNKYNKTY